MGKSKKNKQTQYDPDKIIAELQKQAEADEETIQRETDQVAEVTQLYHASLTREAARNTKEIDLKARQAFASLKVTIARRLHPGEVDWKRFSRVKFGEHWKTLDEANKQNVLREFLGGKNSQH